MGEREPLFNSTMEDILLWRIASHSISQCWGAAAERGQQGRCRNGTLTPKTSQALRPRLCLQLTIQLISADPRSRVGCGVKIHFNGVAMGVVKLQMRETVQANHITGSLLWVRHVQTLLSGVHLSGVKSVTTTLPRINLWRKPDVKCFFQHCSPGLSMAVTWHLPSSTQRRFSCNRCNGGSDNAKSKGAYTFINARFGRLDMGAACTFQVFRLIRVTSHQKARLGAWRWCYRPVRHEIQQRSSFVFWMQDPSLLQHRCDQSETCSFLVIGVCLNLLKHSLAGK